MLNEDTCLLHGRRFLAVQALAADPAVEARHVTVLPRTAGLDLRHSNILHRENGGCAARDELGVVITPNE